MKRELTIKTCSLAGTSDLTVVAPIRQGLVPSMDSVTYKSRVKRVLRMLHAGRSAAHESELIRVLSDAVERVGRIHSVRIAVLEPQDQVLLAVTFDGAWESYVRVIWQKVARLLDLIFCNTEDYVTGWDNSFDAWGRWLRSRQAETSFLYAAPGVTSADPVYLRMHERLQRRDAGNDLPIGRLQLPSAEQIARKVLDEAIDPTNPVYGVNGNVRILGRPAVRQGLRGVVGLHRLCDVYLPGHPDGLILHRAARELLSDFDYMMRNPAYRPVIDEYHDRFGEALDWFDREEPSPASRASPDLETVPVLDAHDIQGGVVNAYRGVSEGALLLVAFNDAAAVADCLQKLALTTEAAAGTVLIDQIVWNIAFTVEGLRQCGLDEDELDWFPEDFRQGMAARAGLLGDLRVNHPRRWRLPPMNWAQGIAATDLPEYDASLPRLSLEAVHAVLQVRTGCGTAGSPAARLRLHLALTGLLARVPGLVPLSLQWMQRQQRDVSGVQRSVEHFGFIDGDAQPSFSGGQAGLNYDNRVLLGEVLLGHPNYADPTCPYTASAARPAQEVARRQALFHNGSFLVVRKLRQDLQVLASVLDSAATASVLDGAATAGVPPNLALAKMMGRWPAADATQAGQPLAQASSRDANDFDFYDDDGRQCPVHAHIRRANPRAQRDPNEPPGARPPRLVRRGMSYGPPDDPTLSAADRQDLLACERGLVFMAYNASIGEQFEVVQRWLVGGNSAGGFSGHGDAFCAVAEAGRKRYYAFEDTDVRHRIALDGSDKLGDDPPPLVRLEWGAYLFAPSLAATTFLRHRAMQCSGSASVEWQALIGEREIERLKALEQVQGSSVAALAWKAALEDPEAVAQNLSASIWAAIRECHGGALRTPYGVLLASRRLVDAALADPLRRYSVSGYLLRMRRSIGAIYLGLDDDPADGAYRRQSAACNAAISNLSYADGRQLAFSATTAFIQRLAQRANDLETDGLMQRWELTLDMREIIDEVLANLSEAWFGLTDGAAFRRGGFHWDWLAGSAPYYPGHFTAPSRYFFQPMPGEDVENIGQSHGQALTRAMLQAIWGGQINRSAPVAAAVLNAPPGSTDPDLPARTLVGALMGFLPTTDGNLRRIFIEWLRDGTLWQLRAAAAASPALTGPEIDALMMRPLRQAMQLRPVPELIWRTVAAPHQLALDDGAALGLGFGEPVVLALVSATQQAYAQGTESAAGEPDLMPVFGGQRGAAGPTHACPGYRAAMGVLAGFFAALVACPYPLRPGPSATSIYTDGPVLRPPSASPLGAAVLAARLALRARLWAPPGAGLGDAFTAAARAFTNPVRALAIGDSWLFHIHAFPTLHQSLAARGYDFFLPGLFDTPTAMVGRRLADFFVQRGGSPKIIDDICKRYRKELAGSNPPKVVFLSAGGNDVTFRPAGQSGQPPPAQVLCGLLNRKQDVHDVKSAINGPALTAFLAGLAVQYRQLFDQLLAVGPAVPLVIHGYDHPQPERPGNRLAPCIEANGWSLAEGRAIMAGLIDQLNLTIAGCAAPYPGKVYHVNLCGTLQALADKDHGGDVLVLWENDLHPNREGFDELAASLVARLPVSIVPR